jgi:hypothetical protein
LAISVLLLLLSMAFTRLCKTSSYWFLGKPYRRYDPDLDDGRDCAPDTLGSRRIRKSRRLKKAMKGTTDSSDTQELRVPQVVAGRTNIRVSNGEGRRL